MHKLHWPKVMRLLNSVFSNSDIKVTVWYLNKKKEKSYRDALKSKYMKSKKISRPSKIYVLGDSHTKGLGPLLNDNTTGGTKAFAHCIPGGTSEYITMNLNSHISHLHPEDSLVFFSGTNDISKFKDDSNVLPNQEPYDLILSHSLHTNVIIVTVPLRKDDDKLNTVIKTYNEKVQAIINKYKEQCSFPERIEIFDVNSNISVDMYKADKLHLNDMGTIMIAHKISEIHNTLSSADKQEFFRE